MRKFILIVSVLAAIGAGLWCLARFAGGEWAGVDETVVEHYADAAGRPATQPFINTDQGDLLLFVFLTAGAVGGFVGGYSFRSLFPPRKQNEDTPKQ